MSYAGFVKLVVDVRNLTQKTRLQEYIERRVAFAFANHGSTIEKATVTVLGVNGVNGNEDKQCRVELLMKDQVEIIVSEIQADVHHAIDRALFRTNYNMKQRIKRKYAMQNRAHYDRIIAEKGKARQRSIAH